MPSKFPFKGTLRNWLPFFKLIQQIIFDIFPCQIEYTQSTNSQSMFLETLSCW